MKKIILLSICFFIYSNIFPQLVVDSSIMTPAQMVQNIFAGAGVTVSNVIYTGDPSAIGSFSGGALTNLGMASGIVMSTGMVNGNGSNGEYPIGSPASNFNSWIFSDSTCHDPQLISIATDNIYDAAILQFDFVPSSDTIYFKYVFASEEYPDYVNSYFNDVFGFFLSGPNPDSGNYSNVNIALIPGTDTMVSINNVNDGQSWSGPPTGPCNNCQYYIDNFSGTSIVYNGFTTVLTAKYPVLPFMTYHAKIGITDVGDASWDSAIFLEANSLSTFGNDVIYFTFPWSSHATVLECSTCKDTVNTCGGVVPIAIVGTTVNHYSWSWSPAAGLLATTGDTVIANPSVTTLYTVIGTPLDSSVIADTLYIVVKVTPGATVGINASANPSDFVAWIIWKKNNFFV